MDQEDRTEPPTERRRSEAREQGLGPRSNDFSLACRLIGIAAALQYCGPNLVLGLANLLSESFSHNPLESTISVEYATSRMTSAAAAVSLNFAAFAGLILGSGLVARLAQVGFRLDFSEVTPDLTRLHPGTGLQKMFRLENGLFSLVSTTKFLLWLGIGCAFLWTHIGQLTALMDEEIATACRMNGSMLLSLIWKLAIAQLAIGCLDYGWQYWKFEQSLKMTQEEVRHERRSSAS